MNLACEHDDEVGLVCAACAVEVQRELVQLRAEVARLASAEVLVDKPCPACEEARREASRMALGYDVALNRLGLARRLASVWRAKGGPLASYMAKRLTTILDAEGERLQALKVTQLLEPEAGEEEGDDPTAQADQEDRLGRRPGRRR